MIMKYTYDKITDPILLQAIHYGHYSIESHQYDIPDLKQGFEHYHFFPSKFSSKDFGGCI